MSVKRNQKAKDSLRGARALVNETLYDFAVSRAYYAMFYAASAMLLSRQLSFSRHSAVIGAFGKEFIKTGVFAQQLHEWLNEASEKRSRGDYDFDANLTEAQADVQIERAKQFVAAMETHLAKSQS